MPTPSLDESLQAQNQRSSAALQYAENPSPAVSLSLMAGAIEPVHGEDPNLPDEVLASSRGKVLEGSYKMCITREGSVQSVTPVVGIQGADPCVVATLKTWQFPKLPLTVCKLQALRFEVP